jgi:hypothetical protein
MTVIKTLDIIQWYLRDGKQIRWPLSLPQPMGHGSESRNPSKAQKTPWVGKTELRVWQNSWVLKADNRRRELHIENSGGLKRVLWSFADTSPKGWEVTVIGTHKRSRVMPILTNVMIRGTLATVHMKASVQQKDSVTPYHRGSSTLVPHTSHKSSTCKDQMIPK